MRHLSVIRVTTVLVMEIALLVLGLNGLLSGVWEFSRDPLIRPIFVRRERPPAAAEITPAETAAEPAAEPAAAEPAEPAHPGVSAVGVYPFIKVFWAVLFLLPLLHWATVLAIRTRRRSIPIKTSSSETISIYQTAIVQFVGNALSEIPAIVGHRVRVKQIGDGLGLRIFVKLRPVDHIPSVQAQIENVVRRRVNELLGIEKIREISVDVEGFGKFKRLPETATHEIPIQERPEGGSAAPADTTGLAKPGDEVVLKPADDDDADWSAQESETVSVAREEDEEFRLHPPEPRSESARIVPASDEGEAEGHRESEPERER